MAPSWKEMLEALKNVKTDGSHGSGICYQVRDHLCSHADTGRGYNNRLTELFEGWSEHSGDNRFPVKSLNDSVSNQLFYQTRHGRSSLWVEDDYGDARRRLLAYATKKCERYVEIEKKIKG